MLRRKQVGGRAGRRVVSILGGLIREAGTGQAVRVAWQVQGVGDRRQKVRTLISAGAMEANEKATSFRYGIFETSILSLLREIEPADLFGDEPEGESRLIVDKLAAREARLALLERELEGDDGDIPTLARVIKKLSGECVDLKKQLSAARARESQPPRESWSEAMTLIDALQDERQRLRLGELIRQHVLEIRVLIVPRRSHRLCAAEVFFSDGKRRNYLIWHQGAANGRKGGWAACSLPGELTPKQFDLRDQRYAKSLTRKLESIDIDVLINKMKAAQE
jgi:hypothetical protein